jgi:hypothetical protein
MELSEDKVTSQNRILLEKMTVVLLLKKFSVFNGTIWFKLCSQDPGSGTYLLSDEYSPP